MRIRRRVEAALSGFGRRIAFASRISNLGFQVDLSARRLRRSASRRQVRCQYHDRRPGRFHAPPWCPARNQLQLQSQFFLVPPTRVFLESLQPLGSSLFSPCHRPPAPFQRLSISVFQHFPPPVPILLRHPRAESPLRKLFINRRPQFEVLPRARAPLHEGIHQPRQSLARRAAERLKMGTRGHLRAWSGNSSRRQEALTFGCGVCTHSGNWSLTAAAAAAIEVFKQALNHLLYRLRNSGGNQPLSRTFTGNNCKLVWPARSYG